MKNFLLSKKYRDIGLLFFRLTIGLAFIYHGYGKIFHPEKWAWLGSQMPFLGDFSGLKPFLGFMASFSEFFGGLFLIFGLWVRVASFFIMVTMLVACNYHYLKGDSFELPLVFALCSLSLMLINYDKYSLDQKIFH